MLKTHNDEQNKAKDSDFKNVSNLHVYIRIRPFNKNQQHTETCINNYDDESITISLKQSKENRQKDSSVRNNFVFDRIFDQSSKQAQIYAYTGKNIVQSAFKGINGTIFCYGQTSSGKTYTCVGNINHQNQCGILPRLVKETLAKIQELPKNIQAKMKISMVEIYNEKIRDLIDLTKQDLKIRANKKDGIFLENVTEKYIITEEQAIEHLNKGIQNRAVDSTNMNACSSRSHMIFIITLQTHDLYTGQACSSKISLVDLAGSQKISKTGAEGKVLQQAKKINASLTALGKVINALSDGKSTHIPYRQSKLTRLLQESLGGNCLTNLIVNVSPSSYNQSETLTSIRFGSRAKAIKNQPKVNKSFTVSELLTLLSKAQKTIKQQNKTINQLNSNAHRGRRNGGYGTLPTVAKMITMHLIPDDDDEEESKISFQDCVQLDNNQEFDKSTDKSLSMLGNQEMVFKYSQTISSQQERKSLQILQEMQFNQLNRRNDLKHKTLDNHSFFDDSSPFLNTQQAGIFRKNSKKKISLAGFYQTSPDWNKQPNKQNIIQRKNQQGPAHSHKRKRSSSLELNQKDKGDLKIFSTFQDPSNINKTENDIQEDKNLPFIVHRQIFDFHSQSSDKNSRLINNLEKIRSNLYQLKLKLMHEKKQNAIKSILLKRKNTLLQLAN